jgi:phosphoglycolate phosphatase
MEGLSRYQQLMGYQLPARSAIQQWRDSNPVDVITALRLSRLKLPMLAFLLRRYMRTAASRIELFPEITTAIRTTVENGLLAGVVSSNSRPLIRSVLQQHQAADFQCYACGVSLYGKASHIRRIIKREKLPPQQVLYVGDEVRDIESSHKAGAKAGAVTWGFNSPQALKDARPDYLFETPGQISELLNTSRPD